MEAVCFGDTRKEKFRKKTYKTCGCLTKNRYQIEKQLGIIVYHIFMDEK